MVLLHFIFRVVMRGCHINSPKFMPPILKLTSGVNEVQESNILCSQWLNHSSLIKVPHFSSAMNEATIIVGSGSCMY